jgi:hypothetical protein
MDLLKLSKLLTKSWKKYLTNHFYHYNLWKDIIAYVKDGGSNLNVMIITLNFIVSCEAMGLEESFQGTFLGMHIPKIISMPRLMEN